jgi:trimeric autotransporter adhesin
MSTKTNFKRIALVAVAALGLGVVSSVPSQAAVTNLTISAVNGTATIGQSNDTVTAAIVSVSGLITLGAVDTITVTFINKGAQPGTGLARMYLLDTDLATAPSATMAVIDSIGAAVGAPASVGRVAPYGTASLAPYVGSALITGESFTATGAGFGLTSGYAGMAITNSAAGVSGARFAVQFDSATAQRTQGVYNYTAIATSYTGGAVVTTVTTDFTITIGATATEVMTIAPGSSTAFIGTGTTPTSDSVITALATASATPAAYIRVQTFNANGTNKPESITATLSGAGVLSYGGVTGSALTGIGDADGDTNIEVRPNGVAGVATITVSTTTRTFTVKTVSFYAAAPATLVASVSAPVANVGTNSDVVRVTATDAQGIAWSGELYIYASAAADALVAGAVRASAVACSVPTATQPAHVCPVSGTAAGTAKFKVSNYATAALATAAAEGAEATSNEVTVTVGTNAVATVKLEFDKATYAPGERARIYVTPLDSTGKAVGANTYANLLAAGGISTASSVTFAGSTTTADSLTAVSITTKANASSTSGARAGSMEYTVYMPVSGGTITISATGGTSLPVAGRVAVTASATVTDSGAAALAAVNALATTVASLRTLITTLTNLVLKIQKKVKA